MEHATAPGAAHERHRHGSARGLGLDGARAEEAGREVERCGEEERQHDDAGNTRSSLPSASSRTPGTLPFAIQSFRHARADAFEA